MRRLALLLIPTLLLGGCASLQKLAAAAVTPPRVHLERARLTAVDLDGTTVVLDFTLDNPNELALRVAQASWKLQVEGAQVASGELPGGLTLPSRGQAPFAVAVRLRWADVTRLAEQARRRDEVTYRVDGSIGVETPIGVVPVDFKHEGKVPVPRLPALRLARVSVSMDSLTDLELGITLGVENRNAFALPGAALRFDLLVNDVVVATGREAAIEPLRAGAETLLRVPVEIPLLGAGRAAVSLRGGGELRLRGTLRAAGLERPIDLRLDVGKR